jgi:hypothetical protein
MKTKETSKKHYPNFKFILSFSILFFALSCKKDAVEINTDTSKLQTKKTQSLSKIPPTTNLSGGCYLFQVPTVIIYFSDGSVAIQYDSYSEVICVGSTGGDGPIVIGPGGGGGGVGDPGTEIPSAEEEQARANEKLLIKLYEDNPDFSAYAHAPDITPAERQLIALYPVEAFNVFLNSRVARVYTETKFAAYGQRNTVADAFRHALWNAINVVKVGKDMAEAFATAHEVASPSTAQEIAEKNMDLSNNAAGRAIMLGLMGNIPTQGWTDIVSDHIYTAAANGQLVMLDGLLIISSHL